MMHGERQDEFKRNQKLEDLLREINSMLQPTEDRVLADFAMPRFPVIFIVGCARAGSTLMLQWLAGTGIFAYPTNLLSRFYRAPYIGAKIQQLLTDPEFNFRNEFAGIADAINYASDLGKTTGLLGPNEFWYFWRRFFTYGDIQHLGDKELEKADIKKFIAELAAIEAVFNKPFALKGLIINWNIPFVSNALDKALFIHVVRHPLYNAQSLLESRKKYFGTLKHWYSFKPREYASLKDLSPYEQVAGQVYCTNSAIARGLEQIDESRKLILAYEEFCSNPRSVFDSIREKFVQQGMQADWSYTGPDGFEATNRRRLAPEETEKVLKAYKQFSGTEITNDEENH